MSLSRKGRKAGFTLIELMIVIAIIAILAAILVPNFIRARAQGQLTACKSNLKNMGTALEMYSTDNAGRYPTSFPTAITPNYLKTLPTCPSAGVPTYNYSSHSIPDLYTVWCTGQQHGAANSATDYPQFTAVQGLIER